MHVQRLLWVLASLAILLAGCSIPYPPCDLNSIQYPAGARLQGESLQLGIIDASRQFPFHLPGPLSQSQASLAVLDDIRWGHIEPEPPVNGVHTYQWDVEAVALDTRVRAYQQAGFELVVVLKAWNTWARSVAPQGGTAAVAASTPPKAAHIDDYAAWISALVERYDADGIDDSPSLVDVDGDGAPDPVRYYQIETEAVNGVFWQSGDPTTATDDYIDLLRTASAAAKASYPDAQILLAGIPALDLLDGDPAAEDLEDIVRNINPAVCGAIGAFADILAANDAYDIVTVHSIADYSGLYTLADWVATLAGRPVDVWVNGSTSAPALTGDPKSLSVNPLYPLRGETLWSSLQNVFDPAHQNTETWYRSEQAKLAFKKWVYAAWSGFDALVVGLEQDRSQYENPALGQRDLAFQGMLDPADGFSPPDQRPVVQALAFAQGQLSGYTGLQRLQNEDNDVYIFKFTVAGLPVYVLWYDDGIAQGPEDPPVSTVVSLPVLAPSLTAFTVPTERGQSPAVEVVHPENGLLTLTITETPLVLRGDHVSLFLPRVQR